MRMRSSRVKSSILIVSSMLIVLTAWIAVSQSATVGAESAIAQPATDAPLLMQSNTATPTPSPTLQPSPTFDINADVSPIACTEGAQPPTPSPTPTFTPLPTNTPCSDCAREEEQLPDTGGGGYGGGGMGGGGGYELPPPPPPVLYDPDEAVTFEDYGVNPFVDTDDDTLSTFAADVDTASFTVGRSYLLDFNELPPPEAIRPEEFINFFDADYAPPGDDEAFAIHMDAAPAPFGFDGHFLMRVGVQSQALDSTERDPVSLVFVVDVSGSMADRGRLETVKESLYILLDQLNGDDQVGIVIYTTYACILAEPMLVADGDELRAQIAKLQPQDSTNAEAGLMMGYDMAEGLLGQRPNTRVILLSDGVANVGNTGPDRILERIQSAVDDGITLTSVGVGMGNFNDVLLEQLANDGDGNYYYVDTLRQAERVFINNLVGTLQPIAFDAKIQVEFDPDVVAYYRLIGYENRDIADEDFRDDSVDAGEIGYGHSITALYEIAFVPDFFPDEVQVASVTLRYEHGDTRAITEQSAALAVGDLTEDLETLPISFRVHASVAELAELMRESHWATDGSYRELLAFVTLTPSLTRNAADFADVIQMIQTAGGLVREPKG